MAPGRQALGVVSYTLRGGGGGLLVVLGDSLLLKDVLVTSVGAP